MIRINKKDRSKRRYSHQAQNVTFKKETILGKNLGTFDVQEISKSLILLLFCP